MQPFVIRLLCFLVPILAAGTAVEILARSVPNDYMSKKSYLEKKASKIEVLVLGSSHALRSVNPSHFDKPAFNLAHVSQTVDIDVLLFETHVEKLERLEWVVLSLSYHSLVSRLDDSKENWRKKNYVLYHDLSLPNKDISNHFEILNGKFRNTIQRINRWFRKNEHSITVDENGFSPSEKTDVDFAEYGLAAAARHTKTDKRFDENLAAVDKLIKECRQRNVNVLLFTPPATQNYRKHLDPEQLANMTKTANQFATDHPQVHYLNLLTSNNFELEDFADADHLNSRGAQKLTRLLNQIITRSSQPTEIKK